MLLEVLAGASTAGLRDFPEETGAHQRCVGGIREVVSRVPSVQHGVDRAVSLLHRARHDSEVSRGDFVRPGDDSRQ